MREANAETDSLLAEAQESLQEATAKLLEEKGALLVALDDEQTSSAGLGHERKSKEATIAQLSIQVQTLTRGSKALAEGIDELHEKLAAAESKSKTDTEKWATERQLGRTSPKEGASCQDGDQSSPVQAVDYQ